MKKHGPIPSEWGRRKCEMLKKVHRCDVMSRVVCLYKRKKEMTMNVVSIGVEMRWIGWRIREWSETI